MAESKSTTVRNLTRSGVEGLISQTRYHSPALPLKIIEATTGETYLRAHIPGAIQLSGFEMTADPSYYFPDKTQPILIYGFADSSAGARYAAQFLAALGYSAVYFYVDGKDDWTAANLPVESYTYQQNNENKKESA